MPIPIGVVGDPYYYGRVSPKGYGYSLSYEDLHHSPSRISRRDEYLQARQPAYHDFTSPSSYANMYGVASLPPPPLYHTLKRAGSYDHLATGQRNYALQLDRESRPSVPSYHHGLKNEYLSVNYTLPQLYMPPPYSGLYQEHRPKTYIGLTGRSRAVSVDRLTDHDVSTHRSYLGHDTGTYVPKYTPGYYHGHDFGSYVPKYYPGSYRGYDAGTLVPKYITGSYLGSSLDNYVPKYSIGSYQGYHAGTYIPRYSPPYHSYAYSGRPKARSASVSRLDDYPSIGATERYIPRYYTRAGSLSPERRPKKHLRRASTSDLDDALVVIQSLPGRDLRTYVHMTPHDPSQRVWYKAVPLDNVEHKTVPVEYEIDDRTYLKKPVYLPKGTIPKHTELPLKRRSDMIVHTNIPLKYEYKPLPGYVPKPMAAYRSGLDYDDYAKIPRSQRSSVSSVDSGGTGTVRRQKFDSAPNFTAKLRPKSCREGWSVKFNCSVTGVPTPEVKWFKGAHPVQNSDRVKLANNYGLLSLEINNVQQDDAGTYSVHASNSEGEATCKASLEVKEAEKEAPREETGKRPRFIYEPRSTGVEEGKKVTLEAQATGKPMPDFTWEKDNKVVEEDDRVKVFSDSDGNTKLVIKEATPKDAGLYFCIASNDAGKSKCTATLRVSEKKPEKPKGKEPWFVKKLSKSVDIGEGETLVLECEIDGDPKPVVQWMRGVREIQYSKRHRVVGTGTKQVLEIDSFLATDAGEYTVQAENNLGQITGSCQVTFVPKQQEEVVDEEDSPKFTQPLPLEAEVVAGENLEVEVKVNVDQQEEPPAPAYEEATEEASISLALEPEPEPVAAVEETEEAAMTFQLDSEEAAATFELADEEAEATMQLEEEEAAATFQLDAGMEGDAVGADMTLEVDQEEASGTFQLGGAPEPDGIAPEFTLKLKGKKVKIDSIAKLTVKVNAMPTPTVTWAKDGETITDGGRYEMFPEEDSYNLEIYDTEPGDSGTYSCTATNDLGSATSSCELLVEGEKKKKTKTGEKEKKKKKGKDEPEEEKAKGDNPRFTETIKDVVTEEGQAASFSCKTAGKPDPEISWTKEGKPCKSTKRVKMSSKKGVHTLTISAVQKKDVGKYVCTAASSAGTASCSATLSIQDVTETSSTVTESTPKYEKTETKTSKTVTVSSGGGGTKTETQTKKTVTVSGSSGGGTQELEISKALKNLSLDEGKNVSLECKVGPDPLTTEAEAFWIRDGQE